MVKFTVSGGPVREQFSLNLDEEDEEGNRTVVPVTIVRSFPESSEFDVELRYGDQKLRLPPEYVLAAAEFIKTKMPTQ